MFDRGSESISKSSKDMLIWSSVLTLNTLYAGGLFHCYMLDKSICHYRGAGSICRFYSIFDGKSC